MFGVVWSHGYHDTLCDHTALLSVVCACIVHELDGLSLFLVIDLVCGVSLQEKMDRVVREAFALATPANTASTANNTPPTAPTTTTASGATNSATAASNATAAASSTATVTSSEQLFRTALKVSAVHFLNLQAKVCAEQLARFCDKTLKGAHGLRVRKR